MRNRVAHSSLTAFLFLELSQVPTEFNAAVPLCLKKTPDGPLVGKGKD
jgi:hypothetical protein